MVELAAGRVELQLRLRAVGQADDGADRSQLGADSRRSSQALLQGTVQLIWETILRLASLGYAERRAMGAHVAYPRRKNRTSTLLPSAPFSFRWRFLLCALFVGLFRRAACCVPC